MTILFKVVASKNSDGYKSLIYPGSFIVSISLPP